MKDQKPTTSENRQFTFGIESERKIDDKKRTVVAAIASESPVMRGFGYEILTMKESALNLSFLQSGRAPVLWSHDQQSKPLGVIESVELGDDRILRATLRFGNSDAAKAAFQDVRDGVLSNISIGYMVEDFERSEDDLDGIPVFRSTMTTILEASLVNVPADQEAYIGRSAETLSEKETDNVNTDNEIQDLTTTAPEARNKMKDDNKKDTAGTVVEDTRTAAPVDLVVVRAEVETATIKRVSEIMGLAHRYNMADAGNEFITEGKTVEAFQRYVLENLDQRTAATKVQATPSIDMENKQVARYSLTSALRAALSGDWSNAGLEREASDAIATLMGRETNGFFVPEQAFEKRFLSAGGAATGAELVGTDHRDDLYISPIFNKSVVAKYATTLSGLVGDLEVPGANAVAFEWLAGVTEEEAMTEVTPGTFVRTLSPKTIAGLVKMSHKSLRQSSPSVDQMVKNMLLNGIGSAIDASVLHGSGASGEPQGILGTSGVGSVAMGTDGGPIDYTSVVQLQREVEVANLEGVTYITNPLVKHALQTTPKVTSTDSVMIQNKNGELVGYTQEITNNVASDLDKGTSTGVCSALFYGDFSEVYIGQWGSVELSISESDGDDFKAGKVAVRIMADTDVAIANPGALAIIADITTA